MGVTGVTAVLLLLLEVLPLILVFFFRMTTKPTKTTPKNTITPHAMPTMRRMGESSSSVALGELFLLVSSVSSLPGDGAAGLLVHADPVEVSVSLHLLQTATPSLSEKRPFFESHFLHSVAPACSLNSPTRHETQEPNVSLFPTGQNVHIVCPAMEKEPAPHASHKFTSLDPKARLNPLGHDMHRSAAVIDAPYFPAAHSSHAAWPAAALVKNPWSQSAHVVFPSFLWYLLSGQAWQEVDFAMLLTKPAGQAWHRSCFASLEYFPDGQSTQVSSYDLKNRPKTQSFCVSAITMTPKMVRSVITVINTFILER